MAFTVESAKNPVKTEFDLGAILEIALAEWGKGCGTKEIAVTATAELGKRVSEAEVYNLLAAARDPG